MSQSLSSQKISQKALQKVLIIGSGGREYALGANLRRDKRVGAVFFAPGNAGTKALGINVAISKNQDILDFCVKEAIDWVIMGSEAPLVDGLSDFLRANGVKVFGPSKDAARLEGSKAFMKDFVASVGIPTARYIQTDNKDKAKEFARSLPLPVVVKASGLCAGKGVIIAQSYEEAESTIENMLSGESFGEAGKCVVIEEFLSGFELSVFGICDGENFVLLPVCQDHKQLYDNDKGPNTGGMGAYTPSPLCDETLKQKIATRIFAPTLKGMKERGTPFSGVLFAGIMVVGGEPFLLEFNVRFGDPECEVLMPLLKTSLIDICEAVDSASIDSLKVEFSDDYCVGVVLASHNYPFGASTPYPLSVAPFDKNLGETLGAVYFAGVSEGENGVMLASGGRVAVAVGLGKTLQKAKENAYKIAESVQFEGKIYRKDISNKAL